MNDVCQCNLQECMKDVEQREVVSMVGLVPCCYLVPPAVNVSEYLIDASCIMNVYLYKA